MIARHTALRDTWEPLVLVREALSIATEPVDGYELAGL